MGPATPREQAGRGRRHGARAALKEAKPDGYTVLMDIHTTAPMMIGASKTPPLTLADRKWAGRIVLDPMVFAVKTDAPWKDLQELSAWVKAHPDQLVWSSVGPSGPSRYAAFDWLSQIGVDPAKTKMVITEGAAESMTKLAGGQVVLSIVSLAEAKAMAGGKIAARRAAAGRVRHRPSPRRRRSLIKGVRACVSCGQASPCRGHSGESSGSGKPPLPRWSTTPRSAGQRPAMDEARVPQRGGDDGLRRESGRLVHRRGGRIGIQ
jgi:hypothetical protein